MFELVVGEVGAILGGLEEERDFPDLVLDAWLETTEASRDRGLRCARPAPRRGAAAARGRQGARRDAVRRGFRDGVRRAKQWGAARFRRRHAGARGRGRRAGGAGWARSAGAGAAARAMGWPELARLRFGREPPPARCRSGSKATGSTVSARCLASAAAAPSGSWRCPAARRSAERPGTPARPRTRSAQRGLALAGRERDLDTLPAARLPLHRHLRREARGADLARASTSAPARSSSDMLARLRPAAGRRLDWQAPDPATRARGRAGMDAATLAARVRPLLDHQVAARPGAVPARHAPPARPRPRPGPRVSRRSAPRVAEAACGARRRPTGKRPRPTASARPCGSAAIEREYDAKLDDLRHNYALRVTVDWVQGLDAVRRRCIATRC